MSFSRLSSRTSTPDLVLLVIAVIWGGSYLATKDLASASSAAAVLCARFLPSALILITLGGKQRLRQWRRSLFPGVTLGTLRAATIALETVGVTLTSATNAGLIIGLSILLTPLLESVRLRKRVSASLIGSVLLALIGIGLLVSGHGFASPNLGDLLILCAACTRAMLGVTEAHFTARPDSSVFTLTTIEITFGAAVFTIWGGASFLEHAGSFGIAQWSGVIYLSLGCTIIAFLAQLWATKRTSASRAGLLLGTEPIWALIIGVALGGDTLTPLGMVGVALLFAATMWGRRAEERWRLSSISHGTVPHEIISTAP